MVIMILLQLTSTTKPNTTVQRIISEINVIIANTSSTSTVENCCSLANRYAQVYVCLVYVLDTFMVII